MNFTRRDWLRAATFGGASLAGGAFSRALAEGTAAGKGQRRACILLWMSGGPSQLDTFDPKPGHANGGPVTAIPTSADGVRISEYLPRLARHMHHAALIRSMTGKEGDHQRATYFVRTGRVPAGPIQYPSIGAVAAKELGGPTDLPHLVSVSPQLGFGAAAYGSGFLGPDHAPLIVQGDAKVQDLDALIDDRQFDGRWELLAEEEAGFAAGRPDLPVRAHRSAYERAFQMMRGKAREVFDLEREQGWVRDAYGRNPFGQGCLLARRLVESGVPFVEVTLGGWDTHTANFDQTKQLCDTLDPAFATLLDDLGRRGLLESTTVVWMGEFGRTPVINPGNGRDHHPASWTAVLAGGGVRGGQVVGDTGESGLRVEERPVTIPELLATICHAIGVDTAKQNMSNVGRPIRVVDPGADPVAEALV